MNRFPFVADHQRRHGVKRLFTILGIARSSFSYWRATAAARDARQAAGARLASRILAVHQPSDGTYDVPRIAVSAIGSSVYNALAESFRATFKHEWLLASSCMALTVLVWDRQRPPGRSCTSPTCQNVLITQLLPPMRDPRTSRSPPTLPLCRAAERSRIGRRGPAQHRSTFDENHSAFTAKGHSPHGLWAGPPLSQVSVGRFSMSQTDAAAARTGRTGAHGAWKARDRAGRVRARTSPLIETTTKGEQGADVHQLHQSAETGEARDDRDDHAEQDRRPAGGREPRVDLGEEPGQQSVPAHRGEDPRPAQQHDQADRGRAHSRAELITPA